jgi:hypothetical protein
VSTNVTSACYGGKLFIEIQLKNRGKRDYLVKAYNLWSFITFKKYGKAAFGIKSVKYHVIQQDILNHPDDNWVKLSPGQVLKGTKEIPLDDPYFKEVGKFEFDISSQHTSQIRSDGSFVWHELITSNKLKLKIISCQSSLHSSYLSDVNKQAKLTLDPSRF